MEIIPRARWGARYTNGFTSAPLPAAEVWLHHSVTLAPDLVWVDADRDGVEDDEERAMRQLEDIGQSRFGGGISYTWLIMPSGRVYEGHGVDRQGSHTGGRNDRARGICLVGDYDAHRPTPAQVRAVAWLLQEGKRRGWLRQARLNGGHRDLKQTACPGQHAYALIDDINRLAAGLPISDQEDDMQLTDRVNWDAINKLGPDFLGHKILGTWQHATATRALVTQVLAAVTSDPDITPQRLDESVDKAIGAHMPTAEEVAAAQRPFLADLIREVLPAEQADLIVDELVSRLSNNPTEGATP